MGKIKNPKQYGGWGRFVRLVTIIPIVGILVGMLGLTRSSVVKNAQGRAMIIWNIFWMFILWVNVVMWFAEPGDSLYEFTNTSPSEFVRLN